MCVRFHEHWLSDDLCKILKVFVTGVFWIDCVHFPVPRTLAATDTRPQINFQALRRFISHIFDRLWGSGESFLFVGCAEIVSMSLVID